MEYSETINGIEYSAEVTERGGRLYTRTQVGDDQPVYSDEIVYGKLGDSFDTDDNLLALAKLEVARMLKAVASWKR